MAVRTLLIFFLLFSVFCTTVANLADYHDGSHFYAFPYPTKGNDVNMGKNVNLNYYDPENGNTGQTHNAIFALYLVRKLESGILVAFPSEVLIKKGTPDEITIEYPDNSYTCELYHDRNNNIHWGFFDSGDLSKRYKGFLAIYLDFKDLNTLLNVNKYNVKIICQNNEIWKMNDAWFDPSDDKDDYGSIVLIEDDKISLKKYNEVSSSIWILGYFKFKDSVKDYYEKGGFRLCSSDGSCINPEKWNDVYIIKYQNGKLYNVIRVWYLQDYTLNTESRVQEVSDASPKSFSLNCRYIPNENKVKCSFRYNGDNKNYGYKIHYELQDKDGNVKKSGTTSNWDFEVSVSGLEGGEYSVVVYPADSSGNKINLELARTSVTLKSISISGISNGQWLDYDQTHTISIDATPNTESWVVYLNDNEIGSGSGDESFQFKPADSGIIGKNIELKACIKGAELCDVRTINIYKVVTLKLNSNISRYSVESGELNSLEYDGYDGGYYYWKLNFSSEEIKLHLEPEDYYYNPADIEVSKDWNPNEIYEVTFEEKTEPGVYGIKITDYPSEVKKGEKFNVTVKVQGIRLNEAINERYKICLTYASKVNCTYEFDSLYDNNRTGIIIFKNLSFNSIGDKQIKVYYEGDQSKMDGKTVKVYFETVVYSDSMKIQNVEVLSGEAETTRLDDYHWKLKVFRYDTKIRVYPQDVYYNYAEITIEEEVSQIPVSFSRKNIYVNVNVDKTEVKYGGVVEISVEATPEETVVVVLPNGTSLEFQSNGEIHLQYTADVIGKDLKIIAYLKRIQSVRDEENISIYAFARVSSDVKIKRVDVLDDVEATVNQKSDTEIEIKYYAESIKVKLYPPVEYFPKEITLSYDKENYQISFSKAPVVQRVRISKTSSDNEYKIKIFTNVPGVGVEVILDGECQNITQEESVVTFKASLTRGVHDMTVYFPDYNVKYLIKIEISEAPKIIYGIWVEYQSEMEVNSSQTIIVSASAPVEISGGIYYPQFAIDVSSSEPQTITYTLKSNIDGENIKEEIKIRVYKLVEIIPNDRIHSIDSDIPCEVVSPFKVVCKVYDKESHEVTLYPVLSLYDPKTIEIDYTKNVVKFSFPRAKERTDIVWAIKGPEIIETNITPIETQMPIEMTALVEGVYEALKNVNMVENSTLYKLYLEFNDAVKKKNWNKVRELSVRIAEILENGETIEYNVNVLSIRKEKKGYIPIKRKFNFKVEYKYLEDVAKVTFTEVNDNLSDIIIVELPSYVEILGDYEEKDDKKIITFENTSNFSLETRIEDLPKLLSRIKIYAYKRETVTPTGAFLRVATSKFGIALMVVGFGAIFYLFIFPEIIKRRMLWLLERKGELRAHEVLSLADKRTLRKVIKDLMKEGKIKATRKRVIYLG